jgi:hypothetical protein
LDGNGGMYVEAPDLESLHARGEHKQSESKHTPHVTVFFECSMFFFNLSILICLALYRRIIE